MCPFPPFIRSPFSLVREREDKNSFLSLPLHPTPLRREATSEPCSLQPPLSLLDDGILLPGCSGGQRSNEDTHQQSVGNGKGKKGEYRSSLFGHGELEGLQGLTKQEQTLFKDLRRI